MIRAALLALLGCCTLAVSARGEDVTVERSDAVLRAKKSRTSRPVAELKSGQVLPVLERDEKWIFSESDGIKGWAHESWLKREKRSLASALVSGDASASAAEESAAVKGVGPMTGKFASARGLRTDQLDRLIALNQELTAGSELEAFQKQGNVGSARGR